MTTEAYYTCDLDPETRTTLKMYLFRNVQNVNTIRNNIIKGDWKCAAIKPNLILDPFQVCVAANRAVLADKKNTLVTRTVFAEILYNLSLSKNISQSLSKFGVEEDQDLLICFLVTPEQDASVDIIPLIKGEISHISDLGQLTNMKEIKSTYKLNNVKCESDTLDVVVSRMVTKNFVAH